MTARRLEFGYHPGPLHLQAGPVTVEPLPNLADTAAEMEGSEGVENDWIYAPLEQIQEGMQLPTDYLTRTGYRLPTEAEWEYACRAGAVTSRYYGETEELLAKYGWHLGNSQERTWPVGSKKPNDLGLFDMHGNVWNWCQERYLRVSGGQRAVDDKEDSNYVVSDRDDRSLRGGTFGGPACYLRSAYRTSYKPAVINHNIGFRLARTFR